MKRRAQRALGNQSFIFIESARFKRLGAACSLIISGAPSGLRLSSRPRSSIFNGPQAALSLQVGRNELNRAGGFWPNISSRIWCRARPSSSRRKLNIKLKQYARAYVARKLIIVISLISHLRVKSPIQCQKCHIISQSKTLLEQACDGASNL